MFSPTEIQLYPVDSTRLTTEVPPDPVWLKKSFLAMSRECLNAAFASREFHLTGAAGEPDFLPQERPAALALLTRPIIFCLMAVSGSQR
jgi:hypothetical protein